MVKTFWDKYGVEGDKLWSENGDECQMGGGLTCLPFKVKLWKKCHCSSVVFM